MAYKLKNDIFDYNIKMNEIIIDVSINKNDKDVNLNSFIVKDGDDLVNYYDYCD